MRKLLFAVVFLCIVLCMNSCDEPEVNPFIGTLEDEVSHYRLVFVEAWGNSYNVPYYFVEGIFYFNQGPIVKV